MDTQRLIFFIIFSFSLLFLWDAWQREQNPPPVTVAAPAPAPADAQLPTPAAPPATGAAPGQIAAAPAAQGQRIRVATPKYNLEIDTQGGDIRQLQLRGHRDPVDKSQPLTLLQDQGDNRYYLQTGLLGEGLPNHQALYQAGAAEYRLAEGQDKLDVRLTWQGAGGVQVSKTYTFHAASHLIDVAYEIRNPGAAPLTLNSYFQFLRDGKPPRGDSYLVPTYTGPAVYSEAAKFVKPTFDDIAKGSETYPKHADNGWVALLQHYFFAAWLPEQGQWRENFARKVGDNLYAVGTVLCAPGSQIGCGALTVGANETLKTGVRLYVGPQEQAALPTIAPGLDLVIDYGWLTVIAVPLFWVLALLHGLVNNWGVAIILLTVLIKLAFYPLSAASYRSMAKMRVVAPKLQKLKEQYGDDRQRLHQGMMELYKNEKINPLGGCLPILVQIPVFIALYWVLLYSVEMRQAPFALWIQDLSAEDPYYILPVIMGVTMFIQTKLNPTPPDPIQAKIMTFMPLAFTVFFFFFPAGLVLYWVVNNVLSIAQQWMITRQIEGARAGKGHAKA